MKLAAPDGHRLLRAQIGEEPVLEPTPPKRKRKPRAESDGGEDPKSGAKRKLSQAQSDAKKSRKVRPQCRSALGLSA